MTESSVVTTWQSIRARVRRRNRYVAPLRAVMSLALGVLLFAASPAVSAREADKKESSGSDGRAKYLFICAGDQSRTKPDFLAVINFDDDSPNYGKVIATAPFPAPNATGNEPHHVGISEDGNTVGCGGLLSILKAQDEIFFFDVTHPKSPKFLSSARPSLASITDDFLALPDGGFLITMMGGPAGHNPGRVVEFDKNLNLVNQWPLNPPAQGFDPHGISVRPEINLLVTSDFVCPTTTLDVVPGSIDFDASVRVWDFKNRQIVRSIPIPGSGTIDVKLIPHDPQQRAYTSGMLDGHLYLVDTEHGAVQSVFDFNTIAQGSWPQLMRITDDGKRLFISINLAGKVAYFDVSHPEAPRLITLLDLGPNSGPHYINLTKDEKRLVVSDYFLNEDSFGKVHAEGDHKVHVAIVKEDGLELDPRFELDFNTAFPSGPARPHGIAIRYGPDPDDK